MTGHGETQPRLSVEVAEKLKGGDIADLCDAAEAAINAEGGFGWLKPPTREVMERYWRGVMAVPERTLFVARVDGVIGGSIQLVRPPRNNEAQARGVHFNTAFMAPWARGHGLSRMQLEAAETLAREQGFLVANMDLRETQTKGIELLESCGYTRWGSHPRYARVDGRYVRGHFFFKELSETP